MEAETDISTGTLYIWGLATWAAFALPFYDYSLTFSEEIEYIWTPRKSLVFPLFIMLRYSNLSAQFFSVLTIVLPVWSNKGCAALTYVVRACDSISVATISVVFVLRSFALWKRNGCVLVLVSSIALVRVVIHMVSVLKGLQVFAEGEDFRQFTSCLSYGGSVRINTANTAVVILFDTVVLLVTLGQTVGSYIHARQLGVRRGPYYFLARDGTIYYVAIESLVLGVLVMLRIHSEQTLGIAQFLVFLQQSVSSVITQRLILNLCNASYGWQPGAESSGVLTTDFDFASGSVLGNIGAPLRVIQLDGWEN